MNLFIAIILLVFLFSLSALPAPKELINDSTEKWETLPFDGLELFTLSLNNPTLAKWLAIEFSRGAFPTFILIFIFPSLIAFFSVAMILAQILIPHYFPDILIKPRLSFVIFLGGCFVCNPIGVLVALIFAFFVYSFLNKKAVDKDQEKNDTLQMYSSILVFYFALLLISGIQGGWGFLPTILGCSLLFFRNFAIVKNIVMELPEWAQLWKIVKTKEMIIDIKQTKDSISFVDEMIDI